MNIRHCWLIFAAALGGIGTARAATAWNGSTLGDLTDDGLAPSALQVADGHNAVLGSTGDDGLGIDRDDSSFTVSAGSVLRSLVPLGNTRVSGSASVIALQAGPQVTVSPNGAGADALLGFAHCGSDQIGTDLLPAIVFGHQGALPAGTHSAWMQETGGPVSYGFDLVTSAVPEPGAAARLLAGLCWGVAASRRHLRAFSA